MQALFRLDGKVALVTGASKGIGEAIAHGLAAFGARVIVNSRKQVACDAVADAIVAKGGEAIGVAGKVGDSAEMQRLIDTAISHYDGIDILVNNAAVSLAFGPIDGTDLAITTKTMTVNVHGPLQLATLALPSFKARGGGSIINISSIGGIKPEAMIGMYSASKAALINLTKSMALDWGSANIRANVICPGLIKTKFSQALWENETIAQQFRERVPLGRLGNSDDIVGTAVFLASDAARYCTGGVYMVDGGFSVN